MTGPDPLARTGRAGLPVTRVYVGAVTAVSGNVLSANPGDGQVVTEVPWYGQAPLVGDAVVMLLAGGQLLAISAGRPS